jgi:hypothetical protein
MPSPLFGVDPYMEGQPGAAQGTSQTLAQQVEELLSLLGEAKAPEQPRVGVGQQIFGSLGDALQAMAAVRAGGAPPQIGAFAARTQARQGAYEKSIADAESERQDFKKQIVLKLIEGRIRKSSGGGLAPETAFVTDEKGNTYFVATPRVEGGGLGGGVQYVPLSANAPQTPLGQLRPASQGLDIREVLGGLVGVNRMNLGAAPIAAPGGGAPGAPGGPQLQPHPRTEDVRRGAFSLSVIDSFKTLNDLAGAYAAKKPSTAGALLKQTLRIGEVGRTGVGMLDPELELLQSTKELIGEQVAFLVTGQQMGEEQAGRLINQLPSAALLTTEGGKRTFAAQMAKAQRFFLTILKTNALATPEVFTEEERKSILSMPLPSVSEALAGDAPDAEAERKKKEILKKLRGQ